MILIQDFSLPSVARNDPSASLGTGLYDFAVRRGGLGTGSSDRSAGNDHTSLSVFVFCRFFIKMECSITTEGNTYYDRDHRLYQS